MKENNFDFYNTLNDLTDLLSEFLYKEICKESPNSFYSYVHENLSIRSREMCQNIDDIFQLDLNPLIAVIHQLKGIIIGMKVIKGPIFFSYLAVIQQIRNITFHKPKNFKNSKFREINWILTIDLVLDELPEPLRKDKSFKSIKNRISNYFEASENEISEPRFEINKEPHDKNKNVSSKTLQINTDVQQKINKLEEKKEEIISANINERLNACILKRTIFIKLINYLKESPSRTLSKEKFIEIIGKREFNKISKNQLPYLNQIIEIING